MDYTAASMVDQFSSFLIQNWGHIQVRHLNWEMGLDSLRLCHSHLSTFEPCNLKMMTAPHQSQFSNWNFPANIRSKTKSHLNHSVQIGFTITVGFRGQISLYYLHIEDKWWLRLKICRWWRRRINHNFQTGIFPLILGAQPKVTWSTVSETGTLYL